MKIGILTHQYINNYGAFLQAWALREAIAELFPNDEVQIIDYVNLKHFIINAGGWFRFYKNRESFKDWMEKIKLPRTFAKARNQEMILSKRCFNEQPRMGQHRHELSERLVCSGISGLSHHGLRRHLCGADQRHDHRRQHSFGSVLCGSVYGHSMLLAVQDRKPRKIHFPCALRRSAA